MTSFIDKILIFVYKISGTRANKSKLFCRSFALSLYKISGTRANKSKLFCRSLALSLYKISGVSAVSSTVKLSFSVLPLRSTCIIFV